MSEYLPNGAAHLEFQVSPRLLEFAVNKYLAASHPADDEGNPDTQTSHCVDHVEFIEPPGGPRNALLARMHISTYSHATHFCTTDLLLQSGVSPPTPLLTLRFAIENGCQLVVSQDSLEFPPYMPPETQAEVQEKVQTLLARLAELRVLPTSFGEFGQVQIQEYLLKRTPQGHVLLAGVIQNAQAAVDIESFHRHNPGLFSGLDRHWGASIHHDLAAKLIKRAVQSQQGMGASIDRLQVDTVEFGDYTTVVSGSSTYYYEQWVGPGLTFERCPIHFDFSMTFSVSPNPVDRFLEIHVGEIYTDADSMDIWACALNEATFFDVLCLGFGSVVLALAGGPVLPLALVCGSAWLAELAILWFLGHRTEEFPGINAAGVRTLDGGTIRVSLADALPTIGGLLWPLRPLDLDWGYETNARRVNSISLTGDLGDLPDDFEGTLKSLHPAYQFVAAPAKTVTQFEARLPFGGRAIGCSREEIIKVSNPNDTGLLAVSDWSVEDEAGSAFTGAFTLVSPTASGLTAAVCPGGHIPIRVRFGPFVFDKAKRMWRPTNTFPLGTLFRADLKVKYLQVNAPIADYVLEQKEERLPLVGTVRDPLGPVDFSQEWSAILRDRIVLWVFSKTIKSFHIHNYFTGEDDPWHADDLALLQVYSDDPGLEQVQLLDRQGLVLGWAQGGVDLTVAVDRRLDHGLETTATQNVRSNILSLGVERIVHRHTLAFTVPVVAVALSHNVLAVATGSCVDLYDAANPGDPGHLGQHQFDAPVLGLSKARERGVTTFAVTTPRRITVIAAPTSGKPGIAVHNEMTLPTIAGLAHAQLRGEKRVIVVSNREVQLLERVETGAFKTTSARHLIDNSQVVLGASWVGISDGKSLLVVCSSNLNTVLSRHEHIRPVETMEVQGSRLHLHEREGGTTVLCLARPATPRLIARYRETHFRKGLLMGRRGAFRLAEDRMSVHCYSRAALAPRQRSNL
jgi:hypothetical protein